MATTQEVTQLAQAHPDWDNTQLSMALQQQKLMQQANATPNINAGSLWDSINSQKDWMGNVGDLSWSQLAPEDQATLSGLLQSNPNAIFQNVEGHSILTPDAITNRQVGDSVSQEATPWDQRASAYLGNYFAPTQTDMLYRLAPEIAAKYGITQDSIAQDRAFQEKAADSRNAAEWSGMNREAALMALAVISAGAAGGAFGGGAGAGAGGEAAAGESAWGGLGDIAAGGGSGAGYSGTAGELAADGLGGVDMGTSGAGAYYDSGAGMWIDSSTGEGIASGAEVPAGYTAEGGSSAIAGQDAAAISAEGSGSGSLWDNVKEYYSKASNAKSLAKALGAFTNSPSVSTGGSSFAPSSSTASSGLSGGVSGGNAQSAMLENPVTQMDNSAQQQPMQSSPLGMIDVSPANNTFLQAGSTWNQQMANALRNRNAY